MKKNLLPLCFSLVVLCFLGNTLLAQRLKPNDEIWRNDLGQGYDEINQIEFDTLGHVFAIHENGDITHCFRFDKHSGDTLNSFVYQADSSIKVLDVYVDAIGNSYVTGYQGATTASNSDLVVAKYDSIGNRLWYDVYSGPQAIRDQGTAIDVDQNGNVYVVGTINELVNGGHLNSDVITIKYNSNGSRVWLNIFQGNMPATNPFGWNARRNDVAKDIAVNRLGDVFIVGSTDDYFAIDSMPDPFGPGNLPDYKEAQKAFFIKYDASGTIQWNKKSPDFIISYWPDFSPIYYNDDVNYLVEVKNNHVYVAEEYYFGQLSNSLNWSHRIPYDFNHAISKYSFSGTRLYQSSIANQTNDREFIKQILIEDSDNYYVLTNDKNSGSNNFNLTKYRPNGTSIFSNNYGGFSMKLEFDVLDSTAYVTRTEFIFVAGQTSTNLTRINPADGTTIWNKTSGNSTNLIFAARTDESGDLYTLMSINNKNLIKYCRDLPSVQVLSLDSAICQGDSLQIQATTNGVSHFWTTSTNISDSTSLNPFVYPKFNQTFTFRGELINGCYNTDKINISVSSKYQEFELCNGDSVIVNGHVYKQSGTYIDTIVSMGTCDSMITTVVSAAQSSTQGTTASICANDSMLFAGVYYKQTGIYRDTLQNVAGCDSIQYLDLTVFPTYEHIDTVETCGQYFWNKTNTIYRISGIYTHNLVSSAACDSTFTLDLTINSSPTADAGTNASICAGSAITLGGSPTGPSGATYLWDNASTLSDPTLANPVASPMVTTTYTVTVTNASACTQTDQITVTVNPLPTADAGVDQFVCFGSTAQIGGSPTSSSPGATFQWDNGATLNSATQANPMASPTNTTTYTVTVTNVNGCTAVDQMLLTTHPIPTVDAGSNARICAGSSVILGGSPTGPLGASFAWDNAATLNNSTLANPMATPIVTTTYSVTVTDLNGCTTVDQMMLVVGNPSIQTQRDTACGAYLWLQNNQVYTTSGSYYDTLSSLFGCDSIIELQLMIDQVDTSVTRNDPMLTANQVGASYQWINCDSNRAISGATSRSFTVLANGNYQVEVTYQSCVDTSNCYFVMVSNLTEEKAMNGDWSIYPNPVKSVLTVDLKNDNLIGEQLLLYDMQGKMVFETKIDSKLQQLDMSNHAKGVYFVRVLGLTKKLIIH